MFWKKTMENGRKYRDIKLVTKKKEERTKKLFGVRTKLPCYYIGYRNEKTHMFINKPVYLGFSILQLSKILMYEFWYDYVKSKYFEKAKLSHM